jgi:pilus assembly protein CpaB
MKKIFPIILAAIIFVIAFVLLRPAPSREVVVAATDLRAGHVLTDADLTLMSVPDSALAPDVIADKTMLIGQPLRIDRGQGDVIRASQIGNLIKLQANERAIAVHVTDATGVAGLLVPGQSVGVIASIPQQDASGKSGMYSKATIEGLRVLYIDPNFAANMDVNTAPAIDGTATPDAGIGSSGVNTNNRAVEGTVLLAVSTDQQTIFYDLTSTPTQDGKKQVSQTRTVSALELLAGLASMDGASVTLYLMPDEKAAKLTSPGLWVPDLVTIPTAAPTQTPAP